MTERFRIEHGAIPAPVRRVCTTLHSAGFGAWIVGGCVRDLLLGRTVADWDVCSSARPEQVSSLFRKVIPTGIDHGTVTVVLDGEHYEVTTLRGEGAYTDGRRPDEVFYVDDVREDLSRRDFTVNAIAYDVTRDEFIDPFDGRVDLIARVVRAVGAADERFREDGLRVLRAARFCATLEFALDPATRGAIRPNLPTFRRVSRERVREEWVKSMKARRPSRAFEVMSDTGILDEVCPELCALSADARAQAFATMDAVEPGDPILRLAALLHPIGAKGCEAFARRTKFSNDERDRMAHLARAAAVVPEKDSDRPALRRWLRLVTPAMMSELAVLLRARASVVGDAHATAALESVLERVDEIVVHRDPLDARDLAVHGGDLQSELGIPPSKQLGLMIQWLLEQVLDDPARNTRDALLALARARLADAR